MNTTSALMKPLLCAFVVAIAMAEPAATAQIRTVVLANPAAYTNLGAVYPASTNIVVGTNEVFELLMFRSVPGNGTFSVTFGGITNIGGTNNSLPITWLAATPSSLQPVQQTVILTGPAWIEVTSGGYVAALTYRITRQPDQFTPACAAVIPSDTRGPVTVWLESSTNLVAWDEALPGTYGSASTERYFRVRVLRN